MSEQLILNDTFFMNEALKEAKYAYEEDEVPIGAIIVCDNRIIARAHNLTEKLNDPTAHAEMQAFTSATEFLGSKYLNECTLYVTVEPCIMCAGASYWVQLGRIVYGADDNKRGFLQFNQGILHPKTQLTPHIKREECAGLVKKFFQEKR